MFGNSGPEVEDSCFNCYRFIIAVSLLPPICSTSIHTVTININVRNVDDDDDDCYY